VGESKTPIADYAESLSVGKVFARNHFSESIVSEMALSNDRATLWVVCGQSAGAVKPWTLAQITYEDGLYIHTSLGSFFGEDGAQKYFNLAQGLEWTGGETFDDFC
jgi:hypothetical protein